MRISDWSSDVCSSDLKAPTRSSCASSSQSSRYWKSASVSPGKPTTKLERIAMSGQISRQDRSRSSTLASLAGRFIALSTDGAARSEEHTSELQSLMRISYAVFCLKKKNKQKIRK